MNIRDIECLYLIKEIYGGSIRKREELNGVVYSIHNKERLKKIIDAINGKIRLPLRINQLEKICEFYNIGLKKTEKLTKENGYFSGLFDSDGSIFITRSNLRLTITINQNYKPLLEELSSIYGGKIFVDKRGKVENHDFRIGKINEVLNILEYFKKYPSYSARRNRILLINRFYEIKKLPKGEKRDNQLKIFYKQ